MRLLLSIHWCCLAVVVCQSFWQVHQSLSLLTTSTPSREGLDSEERTLLLEAGMLMKPPLPPTARPPRDDSDNDIDHDNKHPGDEDDSVKASASTNNGTHNKKKGIPIVIISSLRPAYLETVVQAIQPSHQNINTPSWILNSTRYIFADRNKHTNRKNRFKETKTIAQLYGYHLEVFEGFASTAKRDPKDPIRAYSTKQTWYRMMRYLFHTLNETEVLILEDDAVLAPDGLLMAAALLEERHRLNKNNSFSIGGTDETTTTTTAAAALIHGIALGGHAGANKVNANIDQYMVVRPRYFQAMAYSMSGDVFDVLDANFQKVQAAYRYMTPKQMEEENSISLADWTMEITERELLPNFTQLHPSVGRMHHIGLRGLGGDGNGEKREPYPVPWKLWKQTISANNHTRSLRDLYRFPTSQITDTLGFVCAEEHQPEWFCPNMPKVQQRLTDEFGSNKVKFRFLKDWLAYKAKTTYIPGKPHPLFPKSMNSQSQSQQQQTTNTDQNTNPTTRARGTTTKDPPLAHHRQQQSSMTKEEREDVLQENLRQHELVTTWGNSIREGRRRQEKYEHQQKEERLQAERDDVDGSGRRVVVTQQEIKKQHDELSSKLAAKLAAATNKFALRNNNDNSSNKENNNGNN